MQLGYFQVMAEPVSTWVQEIFDRAPRAVAALGDEVEDASNPVLVAGIPVLHRRVLDLRAFECDELDHRGVELVLVAHRGGAPFQVAHVAPLVGDHERAFELSGLGRVDPEIRGQFHRTAHAPGDVAERPVAEHGGIERGEEVVGIRHDGAEIPLDQVRTLAHRLGERAEDDALLGELVLERGGDGDAVEDRVDRDARQRGALLERDSQLLVRLEELRIDLVETLRAVVLRLRGGVVRDPVVVDRRVGDVRPTGLRHGEPVAVRLQAPFDEEFGLALLARDEPDDILVEAGGHGVGLEIGDESVPVLAPNQGVDFGVGGLHAPDSPRRARRR